MPFLTEFLITVFFYSVLGGCVEILVGGHHTYATNVVARGLVEILRATPLRGYELISCSFIDLME